MTASETSASSRSQRFLMRDHARSVTRLRGLRLCGARTVGDAVRVRFKPDVGCYFDGVRSCGSVWACPACQATIRQRRAVELDEAMQRWLLVPGATIQFVTLTVPHNGKNGLVPLQRSLDALMNGWRKGVASRAGRNWRLACGVEGYVRAVEVTYGELNGFHPHLHVALFVAASGSPLAGAELIGRWCATTGASPSAQRSEVAYSIESVSRYMLKVDPLGAGASLPLALEMTRADLKVGADRKGISPLELFRRAWSDFERRPASSKVGFGSTKYGALWREYEAVTKGRRAIEWSRGLRAGLALGELVSDEDIVTADVRGELVSVVTPHSFMSLVRVPGATGRLLQRLEATLRPPPVDEFGPLWVDDPSFLLIGGDWFVPL